MELVTFEAKLLRGEDDPFSGGENTDESVALFVIVSLCEFRGGGDSRLFVLELLEPFFFAELLLAEDPLRLDCLASFFLLFLLLLFLVDSSVLDGVADSYLVE